VIEQLRERISHEVEASVLQCEGAGTGLVALGKREAVAGAIEQALDGALVPRASQGVASGLVAGRQLRAQQRTAFEIELLKMALGELEVLGGEFVDQHGEEPGQAR
jgi:hypothetical protein